MPIATPSLSSHIAAVQEREQVMESWHGTTTLAVRKNGRAVIAGDGQVTLGQTVIKPNARKVRRLGDGSVIGGFAGATADAFTLFERLERKLEQHHGQLMRAAVDLTKDWRTFASSSLLFLLAACGSEGVTAANSEAAEAETITVANEDRTGVREPNFGSDDVVRPRDARAFCANSRDTDAEHEQDPDTLPLDVRQAGASAWRCMNHKAMVCDLGATGMRCMKTGPMDSDRLEAFKEFCQRHPDDNYIPRSLTVGLSSEWRCDYTTPVQMHAMPVDHMGYYKGTWRVLN